MNNLQLVDIAELSKGLDISRHTIYGWVSQKKIPYTKVGRLLRFDLQEIREWLISRHVEVREIN